MNKNSKKNIRNTCKMYGSPEQFQSKKCCHHSIDYFSVDYFAIKQSDSLNNQRI